MTARSKKLSDQTVPARSRRRASQQPPKRRETRDTAPTAGKISFKSSAHLPPTRLFAETKRPSPDRANTAPTPIPHNAVTQQNRR